MAYRRGRAGIGRVKGGPKFGEKAEEIKAVSLASASKFVTHERTTTRLYFPFVGTTESFLYYTIVFMFHFDDIKT